MSFCNKLYYRLLVNLFQHLVSFGISSLGHARGMPIIFHTTKVNIILQLSSILLIKIIFIPQFITHFAAGSLKKLHLSVSKSRASADILKATQSSYEKETNPDYPQNLY